MSVLPRLRRAMPYLLIMAASLYLWDVASSLATYAKPGRVPPDAWPKIALALMFVAALWGAVQALLSDITLDESHDIIKGASRAVGREEDAARDLAGDEDPARRRPIFAVAGIAAMLGYVAVLPYAGFTVSTFLLMLAIMLLAGYTRIVNAVVISALGTLAFFFVFQRIAYISLPLGVGPFQELSVALMAVMGVR